MLVFTGIFRVNERFYCRVGFVFRWYQFELTNHISDRFLKARRETYLCEHRSEAQG